MCHEAELMYVQSLFSGVVLLLWTGLSGELVAGILICMRSVSPPALFLGT